MIVHHEISTKPHRETENDSQLIKVDFKDFSWTILMPASYAPTYICPHSLHRANMFP